MSSTRIIAIASQKGGVAKTTTCLNIGAEIAAMGHRTLLVDMDPQGHLAEGFGIASAELESDVSFILANRKGIRDIRIPVGEHLDLAPSNIYLAHLELEMVQMVRREDRLKGALEVVKEDYDYVLIDCPPSLGILTVNAFSAADEVLIPMATEFYSLLGVSLLLDSISQMRRELNPNLRVAGILPTRMDRRTRHATEVVDKAKQEFSGIRVFQPAIPEAVAVKDASAAGQPLRSFAPTSVATKAYHAIAKELTHGT